MTRNEPLISVAEAARKLGLNKSTLSRQIAKGAIRTRAGGAVLLSEVEEDRRNNLYPGRSGRHAGKRDHEAVAPEPAVRALDNPLAAAVVQLLGRCGPVVADAAVKTGCSARVAYALSVVIQTGLNDIANEILRDDGGPGFEQPGATLVIADDVFHEPDWNDIAARVGEPTPDFDVWFDWMEARGL